MGLGALADVSLAQARESADQWRRVLKSGKDPLTEKRAEARRVSRSDTSLAVITQDAFEARKAEPKDAGKAGGWLSPLNIHVLPKLGSVPIEDLDQRDIRDALRPIWHEKAVTAKKALYRLGIVMRHAAALGLDVDMQATEKAKALLGEQISTPKHIEAMDWREVPDFYQSLDEKAPTVLAMRFLILTAARSANVRKLKLEQVHDNVWTIPAEELKGRKGKTQDLRIPLSKEALEIIEQAKPFARGGFLFPGKSRGVISDMTLSQFMTRRGVKARPHGFRSSLRTWLAENTDAPHEVAEMMLGHRSDSDVVRAYRRTDYFEQRLALAERWAAHVTGANSNLVKIVAAR